MTTKQHALDDIKQRMIDSSVTSALAAQAQNMVFGAGSPDADVVFVGEAPGRFEDEQGKPFVGASGKFLDELLSSIGMKREDVYITSILKYRPPKNRDPFPAEKQESLPYLQAQLEVIRPKIVATLGRHGLNCFLPDLQIGAVHGQLQPYTLEASRGAAADPLVLVILPLFHPAAALYNRSLRQTLLDDFASIPTVLAQAAKHELRN
ncbi:MAG: uracil-DNA glycosylase [Candidatus Micrarchaeaceae archaeon]